MSEYTATLVRGKSYTQIVPNPENPKEPGAITFLKGVSRVVSGSVKALLDAHAVDAIPSGFGDHVETENRPKFTITPVQDAEAKGAARSRASGAAPA